MEIGKKMYCDFCFLNFFIPLDKIHINKDKEEKPTLNINTWTNLNKILPVVVPYYCEPSEIKREQINKVKDFILPNHT